MTDRLSRRTLFKTAGAAGAAAFVTSAVPTAAQTEQSQQAAADVLFFLNEEEARFLRAAVDRIIPPDDQWPGAAEAGVVTYLDRQLAGPYGAGVRLYLRGPWQTGFPGQGYQLRFAPAELYRTGIAELRQHVRDSYDGREFWDLVETAMDDVLSSLESGRIDLPSMPGGVFFETLLANTIEGYFADPVYGGNRDMMAWRMIGFPGAYAQYVELVEEYGRPFRRPPMSFAESPKHHMAQAETEG